MSYAVDIGKAISQIDRLIWNLSIHSDNSAAAVFVAQRIRTQANEIIKACKMIEHHLIQDEQENPRHDIPLRTRKT